jgi:hypothetical protein
MCEADHLREIVWNIVSHLAVTYSQLQRQAKQAGKCPPYRRQKKNTSDPDLAENLDKQADSGQSNQVHTILYTD